jgi:hypothetical protein
VKARHLSALLLGALAAVAGTHAFAAENSTDDPLSKWSVAEGYSLGIVARGFNLPTAIVAVPTPGSAPTAPRFFVTELRGHIKTIANDGSVREFASVETFTPPAEWPDFAGEGGLGALCLEPKRGYVFVTYAYRDADGVLRNGLSRFSARPATFEGPAGAREDYSALLASGHASFSHQIGSCLVKADAVYIAVGDGGDPAAARDPKRPVGKILRITLDGKPAPGNVFSGSSGPEALVYAWGLRNPFGLAMLDDRLFAAQNGIGIDSLLQIHGGHDHGWNGSDTSIAINTLAVFAPAIGPAHLAHVPARSKALPASAHERFVIAASNGRQGPGVLLAELDTKLGALTGAPRYIAHYDGGAVGEAVTGIAALDDAIYFTPILPLGESGVVLKTTFDPGHAHANVIGKKPGDPLAQRECLSCHSFNGIGARVGPPLDANSILTRTESKVLDPSYARLVEKLDALKDEAAVTGHSARHEVLDAPRKTKVRTWVINRIMNPRFDMLEASMPQMDIGRAEAERIANRLLGIQESETSPKAAAAPSAKAEQPRLDLKTLRQKLRFRDGVAVGSLLGLIAGVVLIRRRREGR